MALKTNKCCCCTDCERLDPSTCCGCVCRRIELRWTKPGDTSFTCDGLDLDCRTCLLWHPEYNSYDGDMECCDADCGVIDVLFEYVEIDDVCQLVLTSATLGVEQLPASGGTSCGENLGLTWSNLLPESCGGFCDLYVICDCIRCCDRGVPLFYDQCESGNCLDRLPDTLTATIENVSNCECFEMSFELEWDIVLKSLTWITPEKVMGECPEGGGPIFNSIGLTLTCASGEWVLIVDSCGASPTDRYTIPHGDDNEICLPMELVFNDVELTACCQGIGNQINEFVRITISE